MDLGTLGVIFRSLVGNASITEIIAVIGCLFACKVGLKLVDKYLEHRGTLLKRHMDFIESTSKEQRDMAKTLVAVSHSLAQNSKSLADIAGGIANLKGRLS